MARQASCIRAWGVLPPTAESMSSGGRVSSVKPSRSATSRAGLAGCQPSGATTRMLPARRTRAFPAAAVPPGAAPSQSSAAARRARTMRSSGSGRSAGSPPSDRRVEVTCPTPTTTGVRGSSAMGG